MIKRLLFTSILSLSFVFSYGAEFVGGYFPSWGNTSALNRVQWDYLTDAYYAFAQPNNNGSISIQNANLLSAFANRARNEGVRVHLSFGGAAQHSTGWSGMASSNSSRQAFANACANLVQSYNLDGINLDWEFPSSAQASSYEDVARKVRAALDNLEGQVGRELYLSAAVAPLRYNQQGVTNGFLNLMDHINVMAFDDGTCQECGGPNHSSLVMAKNAFAYYADTRRVDPAKLIIAIPFYTNGGQKSYADIAASDPSGFFNDSDSYRGGYHYNAKPLIEAKANHVKSRGGGGLWTWQLLNDRSDQYSLTRAMYNAVDPTTTSCSVPDPSLGGDLSICGQSSVKLKSNVSTGDNRTFTWKKGNQTLASNTWQNEYDVTSAGTYSVTVSSGSCTSSDEIVVSGSLPSASLGGPYDLCNPTEVTLSSGLSSSGYNFVWKKDNQTINGSSPNLTVDEAGNYSLTYSATSCGSKTISANVTSSIPEVEDDIICSSGKANLSASSNVYWYASSTSTNSLAGPTGSYSPNVNSTSTYWVASSGSGGGNGQSYTMMRSTSVKGWFQDADVYGTKITVQQNLTLESVDVTVKNGGQIKFNVVSSNGTSVVKTKTFNSNSGLNTLNLDIDLTPGTYFMNLVGTPSQVFVDTEPSSNFNQNNLILINGEAVWDWSAPHGDGYVNSGDYGNFFNLKVVSSGGGNSTSCKRVPVTVTVNGSDPNCRVVAGLFSKNESTFIEAYPNPNTTGVVRFSKDFKNSTVTIMDLNGRLLKSINDFSGNMLSIKDLQEGSYFVKIQTTDQLFNSKIIVE